MQQRRMSISSRGPFRFASIATKVAQAERVQRDIFGPRRGQDATQRRSSKTLRSKSAASSGDEAPGEITSLKALMGVSKAMKKFRSADASGGSGQPQPGPPGSLRALMGVSKAMKKLRGGGETSGATQREPEEPTSLNALMGVSKAMKKFRGGESSGSGTRVAPSGERGTHAASSLVTPVDEPAKESGPLRGLMGVSVAIKRFHGDTTHSLTPLKQLTHVDSEDDTERPPRSPGDLLKGLMTVTTALKRFKDLRMNKFVDEEDSERRRRKFGRSKSAHSIAESEDVGLTSALMRGLAVSAEELERLAEADKALMNNPPKQLAIVMAAKRQDWMTLENELKTCKKGNERINAADPRSGITALMFACQHSRFLLVGQLCEMGALMNFRSEDRQTALHYAAGEGHEEIVKLLLRNRADPNLFGGKNNQLPIHIAAARPNGGVTAAQHLLRFGLRESRLQKDGIGYLPITYAVENASVVLVKEMLQHFAKQQVSWRQEQTGDYLVHLAARIKNTDVMNCLLKDGGSDVSVRNNDGQTVLHISAKHGDEAMVKLLENFKPDPDIIDKKERTPLHMAAENGHTNIVELLVERFKANVNMRTKDGSTLMHLAADRGFADTVLAFIRRGVPLNMPNKTGALCLHAAAQNGHVEVVRVLIRKGSNVDASTKEGYTALHLAVLNCKPEIIQVLLGFGAKVDLKGGPLKEAPLHIAARLPDGYNCADMLLKSGAFVNISTEETLDTPLHISAKNGATELLKLLLEEGADPMRLNKVGESALHIAVRNCWIESAKAIVSFVNDKSSGREATNLANLANYEGESCFHLAAELGISQAHHPFEDVDIIRLLLINGADPLSVTKLTNETSLHYCARSGNPDVLQEIVRHLKGSFQMACNRQDRLGFSPLMTACEQGHAAVTEMLLKNGARADVFDESGKAALHLAAENGHMSCCEMLLKYKAFVNAKSKLGITPLHFAAASGFADLVKMLIRKYRATLNALSLDKKTPLHMAASTGRREVCLLLMNLRANANAIDSLGQNPFHLAAENDHSEVVKLFIKYKPDLITAASKSGMTCAHIAAKNGSQTVIKLLMQFNKQLVTNVRNQVNEALPIHLAVSGSHENVVRLLINAGASPTAENQEGMTAIHMAAKEGDMEVLQAIIASSPKGSLKTNSLKNGLSPLHLAAFYGKSEIVRELQTRVDVNSKTDQPQMASVVSDPELKAVITSDHGLTSLHMASIKGHENVVRLILNNSNVQTEVLTDVLARVPLHYACQNGHLVVVSLLMSRSASHLRLQDNMGRFPLHLSAESGHGDMVSMLLGQGAEINCVDKEGWTPLHYATRQGHLKVVKLLIEAGASATMKTVDGKIALVLGTKGGHFDVMHLLLKKEHDTDELIEDRTFLMDLMLSSRATGNEAVDEFVMHANAPLDTAAKLAKLYRDLASREKERARDLNDIGRHCERMATELLGIASSVASPTAILRARDSKGKQLLDMFLENGMKEVVEHASVQRYLSDIWAGSLTTWSSSRFFFLFMGFMLFPPLLAYFCLPFKHHGYHRIPVIKFMAMVVSHIYFLFLLLFIAAIPYHPIVHREDFFPLWYELLLLAWVSGLMVAELTRSGASTGLGSLRYFIIISCLIAALCQVCAIILHIGFEGEDSLAKIMMYLRNFMLSLAILFSIILILDFLLIHHLFGPFGIIVSRVMTDMLTFIVILFIFLLAFTLLSCCLFTSIRSGPIRSRNASNETGPLTNQSLGLENFNATNGIAVIANDVQPDTGAVPSLTGKNGGATKKHKRRRKEAVSESGNAPRTEANKSPCKSRKTDAKAPPEVTTSSTSDSAPQYDSAGRILLPGDESKYLHNRDLSTLITIFEWHYWVMFQFYDQGSVPLVENGTEWSDTLVKIYIAAWFTVSQIVLLPLLIAILADSYKVIHMRSDSEWKFGRAKLIRTMIKMPAAPPPLNLFVRPYLYLYSAAKHGKMMCTVYASFFAAEDEHEGSDELAQEGGAQAKGRHITIQRIDSVLDWNTVVRRYKAAIKGDAHALLAIAEEENKGAAHEGESAGAKVEAGDAASDADGADPSE